jgi:ketosteroid isomerase-like protein
MTVAADVVRRLYAALEAGDRASYRILLDPQVEWIFMDGFPHGGVRRGVDAIVEQTFEPLMSDYDDWHIDVEEILDADGTVVGVGRYCGIARASGRFVSAAFCHLFRLRDDVVVQVRQFTDTAQFERAMRDD